MAKTYRPANGATTRRVRTPDLAEPLQNAAQLIKADVGTDVIAIDVGTWDLHTDYGNLSWGQMQSIVGGLAASLAAFFPTSAPLGSGSPW